MFYLWEITGVVHNFFVDYSSIIMVAFGSHPSAYLTFKESDDYPVIQGNAGDATKFHIKISPSRAKWFAI